MLSVQAAGWGCGSLIYANVFARPSDETFRPHWPVSYSRASLDRYFDLAAHMLEIRPLQADPVSGDVPVRTRAMEDLVERMDRAAGTDTVSCSTAAPSSVSVVAAIRARRTVSITAIWPSGKGPVQWC